MQCSQSNTLIFMYKIQNGCAHEDTVTNAWKSLVSAGLTYFICLKLDGTKSYGSDLMIVEIGVKL